MLRDLKFKLKNKFLVFLNFILKDILFLLCFLLAKFFKYFVKKNNKVLHISYPNHIAYNTTKILKSNGINAEYLSIGRSKHWKKYDYFFEQKSNYSFLREFYILWFFLVKYKIIHLHFLFTVSKTGWEIKFLKMCNIKIIIHLRGNDARDKNIIQKLHNDFNDLNFHKYLIPEWVEKKKMIKIADHLIVTTRDLLDFHPTATYMPFFSPINTKNKFNNNFKKIKIIHATNQTKVEGSYYISKCIKSLQKKGYPIEYFFLKNQSYEEVLKVLKNCHLSIGKLRMGDYANFQVESMSLGIPIVTFVRKDIIEKYVYLKTSGIIFSEINELNQTIEKIIRNPRKLIFISQQVKSFINKYHNNIIISKRYNKIYNKLYKC